MRERYSDTLGVCLTVARDEQTNLPEKRNIVRADIDSPGDAGGASDSFDDLEKAGNKSSIFSRFNKGFTDVLQNSRGQNRRHDPLPELTPVETPVPADDIAMRRGRNVRQVQRMVIPEGVIISGSISSSAEAEIAGRIDGDVLVEGNLYVAPTALISGSVKAASCRVDGLVEGKVECTGDLELAGTGRLNADALAGKRISLAGQVLGNVITGGLLKLEKTAKVTGDVRARRLQMEDGAILNGACFMRHQNQNAANSVNGEEK